MTIKKKKIPIFIMTLMLLLSLYACGGAGVSEPQNISPSAAASPSDSGMNEAGADNTDDSIDEAPADQAGSDDEAAPGNTDDSNNEAATDSTDTSNEDGTPPTISQQSDEPSESPAMGPADNEGTSSVNSVVALAESLIGAEYEWGAVGPDTFDNSGFVYYCFKENGITVPRKTAEMFASGTAVEPEDLQPGDLVFFTYNDDRSASYVGIYIGDGQFIAENNEESPVCIHDMTLDYYTNIFVGARRYLA